MLKVYAPASIGNVGVGFDLLGAAITPLDDSLLGDVVMIEAEASGSHELTCSGAFSHQLPSSISDNVVYACCVYFQQQLTTKQQQPLASLQLHLVKNLPVGSGLGSSATSVVATFMALNQYYDQPFSQVELLVMMGKFEGQLSGSIHYDNVAPCFLGGLQLMTNDHQISQSLPISSDWYWVISYSGIRVSTKMARDILPSSVSMETAKAYAQYLATFVDACHKGQWDRAASQIKDVIAEPHRQHLLTNYVQVIAQLKADGAKACGISGSGPTLFALASSLTQAEAFSTYLREVYVQNDEGFSLICAIDHQGARVLNE